MKNKEKCGGGRLSSIGYGFKARKLVRDKVLYHRSTMEEIEKNT